MFNGPANTCSLPKINPAGIYLLKINNRNIKTIYEISAKLTVKTPKRRQWRWCGVFLLTWGSFRTPLCVLSLVDFELLNAGGENTKLVRGTFSSFSAKKPKEILLNSLKFVNINSLVIIKWTWRVFFQNLPSDHPPIHSAIFDISYDIWWKYGELLKIMKVFVNDLILIFMLFIACPSFSLCLF